MLDKIVDRMIFVGLDVLRGKSRHGSAGAVIQTGGVHAGQQSSVMIDFYQSLDSLLIQSDVRCSRNRHKAVRKVSLWIKLRLQLPFAPAVIVFGDGETERSVGLRLTKALVAPFAREKSREKSMIRLPNH